MHQEDQFGMHRKEQEVLGIQDAVVVGSVGEQIAEVDSYLQEQEDRDQVDRKKILIQVVRKDEEQIVLVVHSQEVEFHIHHLVHHIHHLDFRILVDHIRRHHNLSKVVLVMMVQLELILRHWDRHREHFVAVAGTIVVLEPFEVELDCNHLGSGNLDIRHTDLVLGILDLEGEEPHLDRNHQVHSQNLHIHGYRNLDCMVVVDH